MSEMIEETTEMADGCPQQAVIDICKKDLEAGKYDTFVQALNAALRHLEVTDIKAFISKQDMSGRWKFELIRAVGEAPADVVDSKEGATEMTGVVSDDDKPPLPTEEPGERVAGDDEVIIDEDAPPPDEDGLGV